MTNEPTAEVPALRAPGRAAGADAATGAVPRPSGGVAVGSTGVATGSTDVSTGSTDVATGSTDAVATTDVAAGTVGAGGVPTGSVAGTSEQPAPGPTGTPEEPDDARTPSAAPARRRRRRWLVVLFVVLLVAALGAAGYLFATTRAYAERLAWTEDQARAIGADLTLTRGDLEDARAEIEALGAQLTTAQERITALADEKAQIGDDREAQRQLLDYQARVSEAAGTVASALERCVQGQDQLIAYLEDAESYDPIELTQFGSDVDRLCQSASDANQALQTELADR